MTEARYVYAILPCGTAPPAVTGLQDNPLLFVRHRDLCAATSVVNLAHIRTAANALRHEAVVEALGRVGPALPVRFGTTLPDESAIVRALSDRYATLLADLDRLTGTVEYGLTALWKEPAQDRLPEGRSPDPGAPGGDLPGGPGTRYMRARLAMYQQEAARRDRAAEAARVLDRQLRPAALDGRWTIEPTARVAARAAYLLQQSSVEAFQQAFDASRAACPNLRLVLSGPWPPYTFVTSPETSAAAANGSESRIDRPPSRR